jgi:hypothetical protein
MRLFGRFKKKYNGAPEITSDNTQGMPVSLTGGDLSGNPAKGLDAIYAFLQYDYESRGYNDALTNPDESYRNDNISLFNQDLQILIERTITWYETLLKETDFHISSRSRAGLIDLVEELKIRRAVTADHLAKARKLKEDVLNGSGGSKRIELSYQRGFMRGLYAISQSKLFNGNIG